MGTLLVHAYVFLMCEFVLVQSNTSDEKRYVLDITLIGHICIDEHIVFQANLSKFSCSVTCMEYPSCADIFYDSGRKQCTGCASFVAVADVTHDQYNLYKLERQFHYIGCFDSCPRFLSEHNRGSSAMTAEFCTSHCLSGANMYALLEYGSHCFCGNNSAFMDFNIQLLDTDCNYTCSGNSSQKCGGNCRGSVYHIGL